MSLPYFINNAFFVPVVVASLVVLGSLLGFLYCVLKPKSGARTPRAEVREKLEFLKSIATAAPGSLKECDLQQAAPAVMDSFVWHLVQRQPNMTKLSLARSGITDTALYFISGHSFPEGEVPCKVCGQLFAPGQEEEEFCSEQCEYMSDKMVPEPDDAAGVSEQKSNSRPAMRHLQSLDLTACAITAEGLAALAGLSELKTLIVSKCDIADEDIEAIAKIPSLEEIVLREVGIGPEGAKALCSMPHLRVLDISETDVEDDVLEHFKNCRSLERLSCSETLLTRKGVEKLKVQCPTLNVDHDGVFAD